MQQEESRMQPLRQNDGSLHSMLGLLRQIGRTNEFWPPHRFGPCVGNSGFDLTVTIDR
jgi:hypothetical protein